MLDPELLSQLTAFVSVVLIDVALAGDNAVVIGTAAAGLENHRQKQVIAIGVALAFVVRIGFALIAIELLQIIPLILAGGILLLWVAYRMWREARHHDKAAAAEGSSLSVKNKSFGGAVLQIAIADISMSLDNVLAVAGAAQHHPWIMVFGLVLSIAMMAVAAKYIATMIDRYRWVAYAGIAIVFAVALRMIWHGGWGTYDQITSLPFLVAAWPALG